MNWLVVNSVPILSIVGIVFDIMGALFIAWEVVNAFHGQKFDISRGGPAGAPRRPTEIREHADWERDAFRKMRLGLVLLVIGFLLQILANVLQIARNEA
jgi:hypothetical protein